MAVRPPQSFRKTAPQDPLTAALQQEVLAEKAGTYGRLMKRLETALAALAALAPDDPARPAARDRAAEALWHVVIQRDLCGFRNTGAFLAGLGVPAEVRLGMGAVRRPAAGAAGAKAGLEAKGGDSGAAGQAIQEATKAVS